MSFVSFSYIFFLLAALLLYYLLPGRVKTPVLLLLSYAFYMFSGPAWALLLAFSTLTTYSCALLMGREGARRRLWLLVALLLNFGLLFLFKYFNLFAGAADRLFGLLGLSGPGLRLDLALPAGISFFTFQSAGYVMDVYRGKVPPERNLLRYALFVAFFPQLLAGPIGRADRLLPQLSRERRFSDENLKAGCLRILWGSVKKLMIADHLAVVANTAYADVAAHNGGQLLFAALCYSFQIYCDFSAYSDIAIGSARLFGVELTENFRLPYAARSIKEFWQRWHISLSTWFRDYLYFPLGGSRVSKARHCLNLLIVFLVSGLWHGSAWTFVIWGLVHGLLQVAGVCLKPLRERLYRLVPRENPVLRFLSWLCVFGLVTAAWVFFRADSLTDALRVLRSVSGFFLHPYVPALSPLGLERGMLLRTGAFLLLFLLGEWLNERKGFFAWLCRYDVVRYLLYFLLLAYTAIFGAYGSGFNAQDFVYFRF